jgi:6-pyruvoyltetrahydropterin/6-carboxytetrahydropterin synthase
MYTICVRTRFNAAHSVENGAGPRERPHRHDWIVEVECAAAELDRYGLVMDFRVLKQLLEACTADFRDALLDELPAFAALNPTAENVARTVHERLEARLRAGGPRLVRTTVWEAEGCSATYRPAS